MKRTTHKYLLPALGLLLALSACSIPTPEPTPTPTPAPTPSPTATAAPTELVWRDQTFAQVFTAEDGTTLMTASYLLPGIVNAEHNPAWAAIDAYYQGEGEAYLVTAGETADMADGDREVTLTMGYEFYPLAEEAYYALTLENEDVVSFRRTYYSDWGGAYPAIFQFSEQFRLSDGHRITFADLFLQPEEAKAKVLERMRTELAKRDDADVYNFDAMETAFREDSFYLTEDSVVFYFQENDIAPHAAGILEVAILYSDLEITPW